MNTVMKYAAAGAFALGAMTTAAFAGSVTQPGERVGLAAGAPLPEGVYFVNTLDWGVRRVRDGNGGRGDVTVAVDIPVIAWSTPWQVLGGRVQVLVATPLIHVATDNNLGGDTEYGFYNPFAAVQLAWDLGGGFGFSYYAGFYFNAGSNDLAFQSTSFNHAAAVSYTADGWNLTANLINGIHIDEDRGYRYPDFFNLDLTATKTFGKWELGLAAYGSWDYNSPRGVAKQSQFALGPLVGYNFGPVILQAYLTRDVYQKNYGGKDTRFWSRIIVPLWSPEKPLAPLVTKY
ncbi:hypothetical protein GCM10008171_34600 [Methylopila jiangsuensis]|uniref:Transporter n=1 Tax=Methylopila jiangsuensis TaxID=586230 RepID=A0A9W6N5G2_9HYPH|nr:transporter [Methylopila jiangsuensis]MDR6284409.1 hypothetical protein [Methylopila jiangsuensis]GLK78206.1 hypothetical protein GCM10008171_34600 [Methylopila jiangsuensis]